jgi:hypothetical protein
MLDPKQTCLDLHLNLSPLIIDIDVPIDPIYYPKVANEKQYLAEPNSQQLPPYHVYDELRVLRWQSLFS